jgi:hypothetical protein
MFNFKFCKLQVVIFQLKYLIYYYILKIENYKTSVQSIKKLNDF